MKKSKEKVYLVKEFLNVDEISYADKGANLKVFDILKNQKEGGECNMVDTANTKKEMTGFEEKQVVEDNITSADAVGNTFAQAEITVSKEELERLNKEHEQIMADLENAKKDNADAKKEYQTTVDKLLDIGNNDLPNESQVIELELKKVQIENMKLQIEYLKKENEAMKADMGNVKGFSKEFDQTKVIDQKVLDEKETEKILSDPKTNINIAQNILSEGLKGYF